PPIRAMTLTAVHAVDCCASLRVTSPGPLCTCFLLAVRRQRRVFEFFGVSPPRSHLLGEQIDLRVGELASELLREGRHARRGHPLADDFAQVFPADQTQVERVIQRPCGTQPSVRTVAPRAILSVKLIKAGDFRRSYPPIRLRWFTGQTIAA